jgi:hypothetical protein
MSYHFFAMRWHKFPNLVYFGHVRDGLPGTFYHRFGPSRMQMLEEDECEILQDYGWHKKIDDNPTMDDIQVQFAKDFPIEKGIKASAGWLAPNGDFYACSPWEHNDAAFTLALQIYDHEYFNHRGSAVHMLEEKGWVRLYNDGSFSIGRMIDDGIPNRLTQKQLDALFDIAMISSEDVKKEILFWIKEV